VTWRKLRKELARYKHNNRLLEQRIEDLATDIQSARERLCDLQRDSKEALERASEWVEEYRERNKKLRIALDAKGPWKEDEPE